MGSEVNEIPDGGIYLHTESLKYMYFFFLCVCVCVYIYICSIHIYVSKRELNMYFLKDI